MPPAPLPLIADLLNAMQAGDDNGFVRHLKALHRAGRQADADQLTAAIDAIAPALGIAHGLYSKAALMAGAFVEWGGSGLARPGAAAPTVGQRCHRRPAGAASV